MMICDLIEELKKMDQDAEVRLLNGESVETVFRDRPEILSDNSSYPVVTLLSCEEVEHRSTQNN